MSSRIARIRVLTHCNDLGGKVWNPAIRWTSKHAVFVCIEDQFGLCGIGECWCFDAAADSLVAFLRTEVVPHFLGSTPEDVPDLSDSLVSHATLTARHGMLASALSAIDIAAWDLIAQRKGVPLWKALSPDGSGQVALYASGGLYGEGKTPARLADEMSDHATRGFRLLKMKIGGEAIDADLARVHGVLDALPSNVRLIIDGVYSYTADEALRLFDALPPERIEAFQSPVSAGDYVGMARLSREGVPVMATEAEYRPELHERLVQDSRVAFLQTAPIACGGISRVLEMSELVGGTATRLSLEVSSTAIALMAACQLAAADDSVAHVEQHTLHTVFFDALRLQRQGDTHHVLPDDPGLGITLPTHDVATAFSIGDDDIAQAPRNASALS